MAKRTTRDRYKRKLESALLALERTQSYLHEVAVTYTDQHPEIAVNALMILEATEELEKAIKKLNESI